MDAETTEAIRHAGNLQNILNQHRLLLEREPTDADGKENSFRIQRNDHCLASLISSFYKTIFHLRFFRQTRLRKCSTMLFLVAMNIKLRFSCSVNRGNAVNFFRS